MQFVDDLHHVTEEFLVCVLHNLSAHLVIGAIGSARVPMVLSDGLQWVPRHLRV